MSVVTISRQYGSGADEIAHRVCVILGYRYFDKELVAKAAAEVGLAAEDLINFSEDRYKTEGFLERIFGRSHTGYLQVWAENGHGSRVLETRPVDEIGAKTWVQSAVLAAYRENDVVIMGRGGQALLQCYPDVLHVRVEAPWEDRITFVAKHEGVNRVIAQEILIQKDTAADEYLKHFHGVNWTDPALYHLIINSSKFSVEAAAQLIVCAVRCLQV